MSCPNLESSDGVPGDCWILLQFGPHLGGQLGRRRDHITPSSPLVNGYCVSFNDSLRDELLNGEIFYTLVEAKVLIEAWRRHYNTLMPHSSL